ncbi:Pentatricopeptide repeat-containing protein [Drosera capensis]
MLQEGHRQGFVISSTLNACADLATPKQGEMIHCQAIKVGCIEEMPEGTATMGKPKWLLMLSTISLISACSHRGLISEGKYLWGYMKENEIAAGPQHYSCMVSLLSRAESLEEAEELIYELAFEESRVELWRTLLSSSVASKNLAVGGRWNSMLEIRKRVRGLMLDKDPGLSWIEVATGPNVFSSGDQSHSRTGDVEAVLERLQTNMVLGWNQDEFFAERTRAYESLRRGP